MEHNKKIIDIKESIKDFNQMSDIEKKKSNRIN